MALERPNRRKAPFSGTRDPRTYIAGGYVTYVEQFVEGSWSEIFAVTGWRPIDHERKWLEKYLNGGK